MSYQYPVKKLQDALAVTAPSFDVDFDINPGLYEDFSQIRPGSYKKEILRLLGMSNDELSSPIASYQKIIFSGHRGCGKSVELEYLHNEINQPDGYFSVHLEMEKTADLYSIQYEDFFFLLFIELAARLGEIDNARDEINPQIVATLKQLADSIFSETKVKETLRDTFQIKTELEGGAGLQVFFASLKTKFSDIYSSENAITTSIRKKIRTDPMAVVRGFNQILRKIRSDILGREGNFGRDIVIIVDGSEKTDPGFYQQIFANAHLIHLLECNLIFSVPIDRYYNIAESPAHKFDNLILLPMLSPGDATNQALADALAKRIDLDIFFDQPVLLARIAAQSGGCMRQFFKIVYLCLLEAEAFPVDQNTLEKVLGKMGLLMYRTLESRHQKILKGGDFANADPATLDLLFSLAILEYNGSRKINPILAEYMQSISDDTRKPDARH